MAPNFALENLTYVGRSGFHNFRALGSIQFLLEHSLDNIGYMYVSVTWSSTIRPSPGSSSKQFSTITVNTPTVTSWGMTLPFLKSSIILAAWNKTTQWWEKKWFLKPFLAGRQTWIQRKKNTYVRQKIRTKKICLVIYHMCRIKNCEFFIWSNSGANFIFWEKLYQLTGKWNVSLSKNLVRVYPLNIRCFWLRRGRLILKLSVNMTI